MASYHTARLSGHYFDVTSGSIHSRLHELAGRRQALKLERAVSHKRTGEARREVAYAITSLGPEQASPVEPIKLWRGHWGLRIGCTG